MSIPVENKGISLPVDQWKKLIGLFAEIDDAIKSCAEKNTKVSLPLSHNRFVTIAMLSGRPVINIRMHYNGLADEPTSYGICLEVGQFRKIKEFNEAINAKLTEEDSLLEYYGCQVNHGSQVQHMGIGGVWKTPNPHRCFG